MNNYDFRVFVHPDFKEFAERRAKELVGRINGRLPDVILGHISSCVLQEARMRRLINIEIKYSE